MTPLIAVDVGNSRIKWSSGADDFHSMPHEEGAWRHHLPPSSVRWAVTGVVPKVIARFVAWANSRGDQTVVINSHEQLPIDVAVSEPESVGMDRLLGALAARTRWPGVNLLVVDAGTAITINHVNRAGAFRGGAILPGLHLMAQVLHSRTAKLPKVRPDMPGKFPAGNTESAIRLGITLAATGAVLQAAKVVDAECLVFTGGMADLVGRLTEWPNKHFALSLTLDGIRLAAEALP